MCAAVRNENRTQVSDGVHWKIFNNRRSRPARHVSNNKSPKLKECARQKSKKFGEKMLKKPGTLSSSGVPNWRTGIENELLRLIPTEVKASSVPPRLHKGPPSPPWFTFYKHF